MIPFDNDRLGRQIVTDSCPQNARKISLLIMKTIYFWYIFDISSKFEKSHITIDKNLASLKLAKI